MTNENLNNINLKEEIWKDIPNYEGLYQVSNFGNVLSLNYKKTGKKSLLQFGYVRGYQQVYLSKLGKRKTISIHQLVAITFLNHKPCGFKIVVDHINNDKTDNRVENLQLITNRENCSKDQKNKSSIYSGVHILNNNKWRAVIRLNGVKYALGTFTNEKEAFLKYQNTLDEFKKSGIVPEIKKPKSIYKNVIWSKDHNKWRAIGIINKVKKHVGYFDNELEAYLTFQKIKNQ
jgi:hypothetical protein